VLTAVHTDSLVSAGLFHESIGLSSEIAGISALSLSMGSKETLTAHCSLLS
jgi:hypothetical protein